MTHEFRFKSGQDHQTPIGNGFCGSVYLLFHTGRERAAAAAKQTVVGGDS